MALHQSSGRWRLGLLLALITAGFWATLPVALKIALEQLDPYTLTWARFAFAAIVVFGWLGWRGELGVYRRLDVRRWGLLGIAGLGLIGNYVFYLLGLDYTTPANAQLLIQAAPLMMGVGAILVFGERYNRWQWLGFVAVAAGLLMFCADQQRHAAAAVDRYGLGAALIALAAFVWAVYALLQKQLLLSLSSAHVLAAIYVLATLVLWPFAAPANLYALDALHWAALAYCALNTLGAYGAFAEALAHWDASRVSVVLALTPLLTVATVEAVHWVAPGLIARETIALLGWIGAAAVVGGSAVVSLMRDR